MATIIKLTTTGTQTELFINFDHVVWFAQTGTSTHIQAMPTDDQDVGKYVVRESAEHIYQQLAQLRCA